MRINSSAAASSVARTSEPQSTVQPQTSAVATKPTPGFAQNDAFCVGRGGCLPHDPLPLPFPFPFKQDAKTRATQANQLDQISEGVRNGSITAQEAERLLKEQQDIAAYQQKAMADGKLSTEEKLKLAVMQSQAALNVHQAGTNGDRNAFARFDGTAQRQADQIEQLADGRRSGTITNTEARELLGDQVEIADARGDADSLAEHLELNGKLNEADREIKHHSKPGTQWDVKPFPFPRPLPQPLPRPELPARPDFHILPFKGFING